MSQWTLNKVDAVRGDVVLQLRHWDGIDRPDYISCELGPEQARKWAKALVKEAGKADRHKTDVRQQQRRAAIKKRDELTAEIERLDREIGSPA